jgi:large subunit ribosomal protein L32
MVNHMRHTRSQTGSRRSHHALGKSALVLCPECSAPKLSHAICMNCGKYRGRVVLDMAKVASRKAARDKRKAGPESK